MSCRTFHPLSIPYPSSPTLSVQLSHPLLLDPTPVLPTLASSLSTTSPNVFTVLFFHIPLPHIRSLPIVLFPYHKFSP